MIDLILANILVASLILNVTLGVLIYRHKNKPLNKAPDANAQEVLGQLMSGPAVFRIECIENGSIIQWRGQD